MFVTKWNWTKKKIVFYIIFVLVLFVATILVTQYIIADK